MTGVTKKELLRYCRIDEDDHDLAKLAVETAEAKVSYLRRQGIALTDSNRSRYGLCIKAWTLHELDHPGEATPPGVREMINDLKFNN